MHNFIWAILAVWEHLKTLQSLHPTYPITVSHFCFHCSWFPGHPRGYVVAWAFYKTVSTRWSALNLLKMEITFYLAAVLSQPLPKTQEKVHSFANVVQRFVLSAACHQSQQLDKVSWPLHLECQRGDYWLWFERKGAPVWMHNVFWPSCLGCISSEP